MKVCDARRGAAVLIDGAPHTIEEIVRQTPSARGAATLFKMRFRNLLTRQKRDVSMQGDDPLTDADLEKRDCQFLFREGDHYTFMDLEDYSQFLLSADELDGQETFLIEEMEGITALVIDGRAIAVELPPVVDLPVAECDPSIRGASATARTKPARLTTGRVVQVPEYLAPGETIRVDTRSGKFVSRA
jgi:elongation factor P